MLNESSSQSERAPRIGLAIALSALCAGACAPPSTAPAPDPNTKSIRIPNTAVTLELVRVPAPPGATSPLWVAKTETTWDLYDVFVYGLDDPNAETGSRTADPSDVEGKNGKPDAVARPSKPYVPPDRGFGHNGFPAMGMTLHGAKEFCAWLREKTGMTFRLPTETEWEHFALGGDGGDFCCTDEPACLAEHAWCADNSDRATKKVATKKPNAFGLFDMHGNVAEWVTIEDTGKPLAKGGSYLDTPERCAATFDLRQTSSWNSSDPQIPKSKWWLADCSFVGFRVVAEEEAGARGEEPAGRK